MTGGRATRCCRGSRRPGRGGPARRPPVHVQGGASVGYGFAGATAHARQPLAPERPPRPLPTPLAANPSSARWASPAGEVMDDDEAVKLLESIYNDNRYGEGEEDISQRPVADVDTPPEGGGEDSGLTTTTTSFEAESREAREELEEGYPTLQLLEKLLNDGKSIIRSHFRRSTDTEVPPLPHRPMGQGRHMCGWADTNGSPSPPPPPGRPCPPSHRPRPTGSARARASARVGVGEGCTPRPGGVRLFLQTGSTQR